MSFTHIACSSATQRFVAAGACLKNIGSRGKMPLESSLDWSWPLRVLPPLTIPGISTMPKMTLVFAAVLITLGLGAFLSSGSRTALLTVNLGILVLCGGLLALMVQSFVAARRAT
jgi:hypothetical protein